jgi:hypothetical protein
MTPHDPGVAVSRGEAATIRDPELRMSLGSACALIARRTT